MALYEWRSFLQTWNDELLQDESVRRRLPQEVIASGWLGFPGATEEQIEAAEARLGTNLPPSYREFLTVTNGWHATGPFIYRMWSVEQAEWFATRNQDWIDAYVEADEEYELEPLSDEAYFVYGDNQDGFIFRVEYLQTTLEISDSGDSCIYLLNPQVVTPDGEWEAWFFSNWGGAHRHRSFWDMMQVERQRSLALGGI